MAWPEAVAALEAGDVDLLSMIRSPDRMDRYEFSIPHSKIQQAIFSNVKGTPILGLDSLTGKKIGLQEGDISLEKLRDRTDFEKFVFHHKVEGLALLDSGKLDAVICGQMSGLRIVSEYGFDNVSITECGLFEQDFCFASTPGHAALISMLNEQMEELNSSGRLDELMVQWFPASNPPVTGFMDRYWRIILICGGFLLCLLLLTALWLFTLRRTVRQTTANLRQSEQYAKQQLDLARDAIFLADVETGVIIRCNQQAEVLLGKPRSEIIGLHQTQLHPPEAIEGARLSFREHIKGEGLIESLVIDAIGRRIPVEISASLITLADGKQALQGIFREISARVEAQEEIIRANRALRVLSDCNQALVRIRDEQELLAEICRVIVEEGGYRMAWVGFAEHDPEKTLRPVAHAGVDAGYIAKAKLSWADTDRGRGPGGIVIRTGEPCVIRNVSEDPSFQPWCEDALERGYKSVAAFPLVSDGQAYGAIGIYSEDPDAFTENDVVLLNEIAEDLAYGIISIRAQEERRRAEAELAQSEAKYIDLYDNAPDMYLSVNAKTGIIEACNLTLANVLGIPKTGIVGKPVIKIYHPDCFDHAQSVFREFQATGEVHSSNLKLLQSDGSALDVSLKATAVRDATGAILATRSILRDISKSKLAAEALAASEAELRALVDAMADLIFVNDAEGRYLKIVDVSPSMLYRPSQDLIGKTLHEVFPADQADFFLNHIRQALATRRPVSFEYSLPIGESIAWFDATVSPMTEDKVVTVARDITLRKIAEDELRQNQELLLEAQQIGHIGNWWHDLVTGEIYWSDEFFRILGIEPQEPSIELSISLIHPDDLHIILSAMEKPTAGEQEHVQEFRIVRPDGEVRWIHNRWKSITDQEGKEIKRVGTHQDITVRKQMYEAVHSSEER